MAGIPFVILHSSFVTRHSCEAAVDGQRILGHLVRAEVNRHGFASTAAKLIQDRWILPEIEQPFHERLGVVRFDENPTAGKLYDFGKRALARLHNRHTVSHGLEQIDPFGFVVGRGYGQQAEALKKGNLGSPIQFAVVPEFTLKSPLCNSSLYIREIAPVLRRQITRSPEPARKMVLPLPQTPVCFAKSMQPRIFFRGMPSSPDMCPA